MHESTSLCPAFWANSRPNGPLGKISASTTQHDTSYSHVFTPWSPWSSPITHPQARQQRAFYLQSERIAAHGGRRSIARHRAGEIALVHQPATLATWWRLHRDERGHGWESDWSDVAGVVAEVLSVEMWNRYSHLRRYKVHLRSEYCFFLFFLVFRSSGAMLLSFERSSGRVAHNQAASSLNSQTNPPACGKLCLFDVQCMRNPWDPFPSLHAIMCATSCGRISKPERLMC